MSSEENNIEDRLDASSADRLDSQEYHQKPSLEFQDPEHNAELELSVNSSLLSSPSEFSYASEIDLLLNEDSLEDVSEVVEEERLDLLVFDDGDLEDSEEDDEVVEEVDYKDILKKSKDNVIDEEPEYAIKEFKATATLQDLGTPEDLIFKLEEIGYHCAPYLAAQVALAVNTKSASVRSMLLEGPPGCGKSYLAKSIARLTGAEYMCLSCYPGMDLQQLIEAPSSMALAKAISAKEGDDAELVNLGVISRAFKASQEKPVILLVDEIDKVHLGIDTFFLGPIQDAEIHLESEGVIKANTDNLLVVFTKNFDRSLNDALLRRVHPITLTFLESDQEKKILSNYCIPELISNLVRIADVMRYSEGAYEFDRPPAPEELLKIGKYITQLLDWDIVDYTFVGRNIWQMVAKSEGDRQILELLLRYHPDFHDTLYPNGRKLSKDQVYARLGREVLKKIVSDPEDAKRKKAYKAEKIGWLHIGSPNVMIDKLEEVGYECLPFLATQVSLLLNTPTEKVRTILLEGPPGCGKSYLAKALATISGADFLCLSCYSGMNTQHLIEAPSELALANAMAGNGTANKSDLMNLGILSRAFLKSQNQPVILLIDEIDKVDVAIDTFFLGPLQDGTIFLESQPAIDANLDNLLIVFTKNYERELNDALLRRLHPIKMTYLDSKLERKILSVSCDQKLVDNLVSVVDRMRNSGGSYGFDRPPAPEELKTIGNYINKLIDWGITDFREIGSNIWNMISKSEHDRAVLEHMIRFHPDYFDPLYSDGKNLTIDQVHAKFGKVILKDIIKDPEEEKREDAWRKMEEQ